MGSSVACASIRTMSSMRWGPTMQFAPIASTSSALISRAKRSGNPSMSVSPSSMKPLEAIIGRSGARRRTARIATVSSRGSTKVSRMMPSTPASIRACACSSNACSASWSRISPSGSSGLPTGPIEPNTSVSCPTASRANCTPAMFTRRTNASGEPYCSSKGWTAGSSLPRSGMFSKRMRFEL
jgi:hypothetical protein